MLKISSNQKLDFDKYEKNLRISDPYIWINITKMIQEVDRQTAEYYAIKYQLENLMFRISGGFYRFIDKTTLIDFFVNCLGVDIKKFKSKSSAGKSIDAKKVITPLYENFLKLSSSKYGVYDDIVEFFELYFKQVRLKTITANARQYVLNLQKAESEISNFGQQLKKMQFIYEKKQNCRYYSSNSNVQAIPEEYFGTIEMPKGYIIVSADASQADLREACEMIFLQDREFKAVYDEEDDKYKAIAKYIKKKNNKPWDENEFLDNRQGYKTSTLAKVYGSHSTTSLGSGFKNIEDQHMLESFIENNPAYKQYCLEMKQAADFQHDIITYDIFGNPSHWSPFSNDIMNQLKNAPIQSTTSAILIAWSTAIIDRFREKGYDEEKFGILLNRHDEIVFYMHIDALKDSWIFKQNSSLAVDDWGELCFEPHFYFSYKVDCPELTKIYEESCEEHKDEITSFERQLLTVKKKYRFTKKLCRVYTYAPVSLYDFCKLRNFNGLDLSELENYKKSESEAQADACKKLVREYLKRENLPPYIVQDLNNYRKYWNIFIVYDLETLDCKVLKGYHNYIEYLKENDFGYVICNNTVTDVYINLNSVQIQNYVCSTDSVLDNILKHDIDINIEEYSANEDIEDTDSDFESVESLDNNSETNIFDNSSSEDNVFEIVRVFKGISIYEDELKSFDDFNCLNISYAFKEL